MLRKEKKDGDSHYTEENFYIVLIKSHNEVEFPTLGKSNRPDNQVEGVLIGAE